jgi:hypothetical protein
VQSARPTPSTPDEASAEAAAADLRSRRKQILATTALLWPGFTAVAWVLQVKFRRIFAAEEVPAFSRTVFSVHPLVFSVVMLAGLGGWAILHLRMQDAALRRGVGLALLGLWCAAAGVLCLAFLAPLLGLRVNI